MAKFEFGKIKNLYVENLFRTVDNSKKFLLKKNKEKIRIN